MRYGAFLYGRSGVGVRESAIGWAPTGHAFWLCHVYDQIDGEALLQRTLVGPPLGQESSTAHTAHQR